MRCGLVLIYFFVFNDLLHFIVFFLDIEEIETTTIIIVGEVAVVTANLHAAAAAWTAAAVVVASQVEAAAIEAPDAAVSPSNQV